MTVDPEDLHVFKLADALAADVTPVARAWSYEDRRHFGDQLIRAVNAVPALIVEACGRGTLADRRRILKIAYGEALEARQWLRATARLGLVADDMPERAAHVVRVVNLFYAKPGGRP